MPIGFDGTFYAGFVFFRVYLVGLRDTGAFWVRFDLRPPLVGFLTVDFDLVGLRDAGTF